MKFPARSFLAVALGALTLGATHPPAEQNAKRAAMERMRTFFRADMSKGIPVPSAIRRIQLMHELSTSAVRAAEFKGSRPDDRYERICGIQGEEPQRVRARFFSGRAQQRRPYGGGQLGPR